MSEPLTTNPESTFIQKIAAIIVLTIIASIVLIVVTSVLYFLANGFEPVECTGSPGDDPEPCYVH